MDVAEMKALDALTAGNKYSDEVFAAIATPYTNYLKAAQQLRQLPQGEVYAPFAFLPGGQK